MKLLKEQIRLSEKDGAKTVGYILLEISKISKDAAELIEQDLEIHEMSLEKCFNSIYEYAKKNKKGNAFSCAVFKIDAENEIIKIILDFYKIPTEWISEPKAKTATEPKKNLLDLI